MTDVPCLLRTRRRILWFYDYFGAVPEVPICVEPSSHKHVVSQYMLDGLVCFFPPPVRSQI